MEKLMIGEVVHAPNGEALVSYIAEQADEPSVYCSNCGAMLITIDDEGISLKHKCRGLKPLVVIRRFGSLNHSRGNGTTT